MAFTSGEYLGKLYFQHFKRRHQESDVYRAFLDARSRSAILATSIGSRSSA